MRRKLRRIGYITLVLIAVSALLALTPFALRALSAAYARSHTYTAQEVPQQRTALILGARVMPSGRPSAMLYDRIMAGVDLYQQGKVEVLLMSGDGRTDTYNEPAVMKRVAMQAGVPEEAILTDRAGLRTLESCRRARDAYALNDLVLVTQAFHLDRALLTCRSLGLDAVGVAADYRRPQGYSERTLRWSEWREVWATTRAFLDLTGVLLSGG